VGRIENEVLRRFVAARDAGDAAAADRHYNQLMQLYFDRVGAWVRFESGSRLDAQEREDAVERALVRISVNLRLSFNGSSVGEWVSAARTAVKFACIDTQRASIRKRKHEVPLDETRSDDDDRGRYDDAEHREAMDRLAQAEADAARVEFFAAEAAFLDWAAGKLSPRRREVLELMRQGKATREIMEILGIGENNVHQTYRRILEDLRTLHDDYTP
jgi:RNA polymerase sigma factor (sigma-70 family)